MGFVERLLIFLMVLCIVGILWFIIVQPVLNYIEKKYKYKKEDDDETINLPEELNELKEEVEQDVIETKILEEKGKLLETAVITKDKLLDKKEKAEKLEKQLRMKRVGKSTPPVESKPPKTRKEN